MYNPRSPNTQVAAIVGVGAAIAVSAFGFWIARSAEYIGQVLIIGLCEVILIAVLAWVILRRNSNTP